MKNKTENNKHLQIPVNLNKTWHRPKKCRQKPELLIPSLLINSLSKSNYHIYHRYYKRKSPMES